MKAIELCVNRFDEDTRSGFLDLYTKIDADVNAMDEALGEVEKTEDHWSNNDEFTIS